VRSVRSRPSFTAIAGPWFGNAPARVLDASGGSDDDGPLVCSSGQTSNAGNGPSMYPGETCNECHAFTLAGTDSTGAVMTLPVNSVGNLYSTSFLSTLHPLTARPPRANRYAVLMA
jgi:hypothetical protein